ncbi:unnamed protein product [Calypogeia fissa]
MSGPDCGGAAVGIDTSGRYLYCTLAVERSSVQRLWDCIFYLCWSSGRAGPLCGTGRARRKDKIRNEEHELFESFWLWRKASSIWWTEQTDDGCPATGGAKRKGPLLLQVRMGMRMDDESSSKEVQMTIHSQQQRWPDPHILINNFCIVSLSSKTWGAHW